MELALAKIREVVEGDPDIANKLSDYEGYPAFTFQTAQKGMEFPYIVMRVEANNPDEEDYIDRMILSFEVYFGDGDATSAFLVAKRISKLINNIKDIENNIISCHRQGDLPIPDEDPNVVHLSCKYLVRLNSTDTFL